MFFCLGGTTSGLVRELLSAPRHLNGKIHILGGLPRRLNFQDAVDIVSFFKTSRYIAMFFSSI